jgi:predicted DNA-binding transcriptional regulator AlpA
MIATAAPVVILTRDELDTLIRDAARAAVAEAAKLAPRSSNDEGELWTAQHIAERCGVSAYTVAYQWATQRNFPAAVVLGEGPKAARRWYRKEIEQWLRAKQAK